jgi:hypothetical protein
MNCRAEVGKLHWLCLRIEFVIACNQETATEKGPITAVMKLVRSVIKPLLVYFTILDGITSRKTKTIRWSLMNSGTVYMYISCTVIALRTEEITRLRVYVGERLQDYTVSRLKTYYP